jgi:hypothetical protein
MNRNLIKMVVLVVICTICYATFSHVSSSRVTGSSPLDNALTKRTSSSGPLANDLAYRGIAYVSYEPEQYTNASARISLDRIKSIGANYVSVLATQYMNSGTSTDIFVDPQKTPTDAAVIDAINDIHSHSMGVMLKPHVDCEDLSPRNFISPSNVDEWFENYTKFITHYARIAQTTHVELFCVGCEFDSLSTSVYYNKWNAVISEVRAVYAGPITYAALFAAYTKVPFWNLVDYAGVDAYFPVSDVRTPTVEDAVRGWSQYTNGTLTHNWVHEIEAWQATINKQVIFTEIGYCSIDYAGQMPYDWERAGAYNALAQAHCYDAVFTVFNNKQWLAGMFWCYWYPDPNAGGYGNTDYTPQNKPAQDILAAHYLS